jgi:rhodanese-related sulfurtransferase
LDPNAFHQWEDQVPRDVPLYLYCTCIREATSARIALMLLGRGLECRVLRGGLRKWKEAGLPLEQVPKDEVSELPVFG